MQPFCTLKKPREVAPGLDGVFLPAAEMSLRGTAALTALSRSLLSVLCSSNSLAGNLEYAHYVLLDPRGSHLTYHWTSAAK